MAASSCQTLLLVCVSFFLIATFLGGGAHANNNSPKVVYSDEDAAHSPFHSYDISPGPMAEAPNSQGAATTQEQGGDKSSSGGGGGTTSASTAALNVTPFKSVPTVKDTPAVNMFVQSTMVKSMSKTKNFIDDVIDKRLNDPATDRETRACLQTCKDAYEDSVSAMKKTVEDVKDGNLYKANVDVSAMSSNADTCKDCMKYFYGNADPEFKTFEAWLDGVSNDCLDKITGLRN